MVFDTKNTINGSLGNFNYLENYEEYNKSVGK